MTGAEHSSGTIPPGMPARVRAEMARHGVTQQRMALFLGWTQQRVSRRLTGQVLFTAGELAQVERALGMPEGSLTAEGEST